MRFIFCLFSFGGIYVRLSVSSPKICASRVETLTLQELATCLALRSSGSGVVWRKFALLRDVGLTLYRATNICGALWFLPFFVHWLLKRGVATFVFCNKVSVAFFGAVEKDLLSNNTGYHVRFSNRFGPGLSLLYPLLTPPPPPPPPRSSLCGMTRYYCPRSIVHFNTTSWIGFNLP